MDPQTTNATDTDDDNEQLEFGDDGRAEFKLREPIEIKKKDGTVLRTITVLKVRKPIAKDLFSLPVQPTMQDLGSVVARVTGEPLEIIGRMDPKDFLRLQMSIQSFFDFGQ